jgi:hypothetical protein
MSILAVTGGLRGTDQIELFPYPSKTVDGKFNIDFFARGMRFFADPNVRAADELMPGTRLFVMHDLQNEHDAFALCLRTGDPSYLENHCQAGKCWSTVVHAFVMLTRGNMARNLRALRGQRRLKGFGIASALYA